MTLEVIAAMQRYVVVPAMITYNALVSTCEKGAQPERFLEVFNAMQQQGQVPSVITYGALISSCDKCK